MPTRSSNKFTFSGAVYRRATTWPSSRVSLECLCADDFGAGYKEEDDLTDYDHEIVENFDETCAAQDRMAELVQEANIDAHVDVMRTDDRDSYHQDCYVRFDLKDVEAINQLLDQAGLTGDVLDIEDDLYDEWADRIEDRFMWQVESAG